MIGEPRIHIRLKGVELCLLIACLHGEQFQLHNCILSSREIDPILPRSAPAHIEASLCQVGVFGRVGRAGDAGGGVGLGVARGG